LAPKANLKKIKRRSQKEMMKKKMKKLKRVWSKINN